MKESLPCIYCQAPAHPKSIKTSFLGFPKFTCGQCGKKNRYPASSRSKKLFKALASIFVFIFVVGFLAGEIILPGIIFLAGFFGLATDYAIRKEHTKQGDLGKSETAMRPQEK